jgi:chromosome segregation protein
MRGLEEYEQVHAVVAERMSRVETLKREMNDIQERIEFFSKKKYEAFQDAFTSIDANFRDIFSRLTMGSGELRLENPDDPFTGGLSFAVQPRDKKVHISLHSPVVKSRSQRLPSSFRYRNTYRHHFMHLMKWI